jgi:hypothetical protein
VSIFNLTGNTTSGNYTATGNVVRQWVKFTGNGVATSNGS